jgi:hypothetical protein
MKRRRASLAVAGGYLAPAASALACAAGAAGTAGTAGAAAATRHRAPALRFSIMEQAAVSGRATAYDGNSLTIQTAGVGSGVVNALIAKANAITAADLPYVWAGGHAQAGVASVGSKGPGYTGRTDGFDCSGAVAAVLSGGGLWPSGSGVPNDAGVISTLRAEGLIASGVGSGTPEVTLYDDPGVHIFMNIDGRFFGTSDGEGGNPSQKNGGAGWLDDGAPDADSSVFMRYHFVASALAGSPSASNVLTFQLSSLEAAGEATTFAVGDQVKVSYQQASTGSMFALSVSLLGAHQASGTVQSLAGSTIVLKQAAGKLLTLSVPDTLARTSGLGAGDTVSLTYVTTGGRASVRGVKITATPSGTPGQPGGANAKTPRPQGSGTPTTTTQGSGSTTTPQRPGTSTTTPQRPGTSTTTSQGSANTTAGAGAGSPPLTWSSGGGVISTGSGSGAAAGTTSAPPGSGTVTEPGAGAGEGGTASGGPTWGEGGQSDTGSSGSTYGNWGSGYGPSGASASATPGSDPGAGYGAGQPVWAG